MAPLMQSADVGDVLLFSGRRLSGSSVGWVVDTVGIGQDGTHSGSVDGVGDDGARNGG